MVVGAAAAMLHLRVFCVMQALWVICWLHWLVLTLMRS